MVRSTALALTVLTGTSALVYEVAWQKYLATLLGSHGEATAAVLAIFLGGLSAGYALFGRITRRLVARARRARGRPHLLAFYGLVEGAIGGYALLFPLLFGLAQRLSLLVPRGHAGLGFAFDVALSALLIGPPTLLMGGTIPVLTLALARDLGHATRIHAAVYGLNTVGAFFGALLGGFWIVPRLGLDGTLLAMGLVNLSAGAGFALLELRAQRIAPDLAPAAAPAGPVPRFAAFAAVALLAGFAMMALQTTLNRIGALALGASSFTFAMVVAVFVFCIALGSLAVSALPRVPRRLLLHTQWLLFLLLLLVYLGVPDAPYAAHVIRTLFQGVDAAFYPFHAFVFVGLAAVLAVPIGLSGALLPLVFHELRREVADLGAVAGRLYAWNTVGSLLGALLGGYALLFWLDLHHVYRIALGALALEAAILLVLTRAAKPALAAPCALAAIAALWLLPTWDPERLTVGLFRERTAKPETYLGADVFFARPHPGRKLVFYDDDPISTVSVLRLQRKAGRPDLGIVVNGKSDGSIVADYPTMALAALLPALMAESHERAFVIGWGTGVTVGELAALDGTREITAAEISPAVLAAAPLFDGSNLGASKSPKVGVRRGDAYRSLLQSDERYDVIVSEPSNPWVTGVEMLYSVEFLEAARSRLAPGGVYAQWFHTYETDFASVELVLRNYAAVFPHVSVWYTVATDVLLLGFDRPERALDLAALEQRFRQPDFEAGFARVGIRSFAALLAHELLPLDTLAAGGLTGPLHTLRHPILSHRAARAFFRGEMAEVPRLARPESAEVGARNSLWARHARGGDGALAESALEDAVHENCRSRRDSECATFLARWRHDHPDSLRYPEALAEAREASGGSSLLSDRNLARIERLFGAGGGRNGGEPDRGGVLARAQAKTQRFLRYYHHAVPFDRGVLVRAWRECRLGPCEQARSQAEERLGPLGRGASREPAARAEPG
jgi:predicted membrane-bound spermidine synthase